MNKQIKTSVGVIIILIITATVAVFVWKFQKKQTETAQQTIQAIKTAQIPNQPMQPVADVTVDWQTYKNDKYGFEFKYPRDWIAEITADDVYTAEGNNGTDAVNTLKPKKQENCGVGEGGSYACMDFIKFGVIKNENKLELRSFLENVYGWTKESGLIKNDLKQTKMGNGLAYRFTGVSGFDGTLVPHFWVTLSDGNFFNIYGSYLNKDQLKIFENVVASFKFVK